MFFKSKKEIIYKKTTEAISKSYNLIDTLNKTFWLTLMDENDFNNLNEKHYKKKDSYQKDSYNKRGLFGWEEKVVNKYFNNKKNLLIIAAGGGREAYSLLKLGYSVDCFEPSSVLASSGSDFLKREGYDVKINVSPPSKAPELSKVYDGVIIGWGAYTHVLGQENRVELLKDLNKLMKKGTPVLLSFWQRENLGKKTMYSINTANYFRSILKKKKLEYGDTLFDDYYVHVFNKKEVEYELSLAGFDLVEYNSTDYGYAVGQRK